MLKTTQVVDVGKKKEALTGKITTLLGKGGSILNVAQTKHLMQLRDEIKDPAIDGERVHSIAVDVKKIGNKVKKEIPPVKKQGKPVAVTYKIFSKMEATQTLQ